MKQNSSSRRVNEQARQVIAETLMFEFSDPRISQVTVTGCEVSFDRSVCNVYYTTTPGAYDETQGALTSAAGRLRSLLAKKLSWRTSPELRFFLDKSVDEAERIAHAIEHERQRGGAGEQEGAPAGEPEVAEEGAQDGAPAGAQEGGEL